jgi:hypothetical protein
MNDYKAHRELLTLDGKYMLAAAYALSGQPSQAEEKCLCHRLSPEKFHRVALSGSSYSYNARLSRYQLSVLMDYDPDNSQGRHMRPPPLSEDIGRRRY